MTASADKRARTELLTTLIWAGKQRGLSLLKVDAENIARVVWGKDVSLHGIVMLGEKFGFRRSGPVASIPLRELWPRRLADTACVPPMHETKQLAVDDASGPRRGRSAVRELLAPKVV